MGAMRPGRLRPLRPPKPQSRLSQVIDRWSRSGPGRFLSRWWRVLVVGGLAALVFVSSALGAGDANPFGISDRCDWPCDVLARVVFGLWNVGIVVFALALVWLQGEIVVGMVRLGSRVWGGAEWLVRLAGRRDVRSRVVRAVLVLGAVALGIIAFAAPGALVWASLVQFARFEHVPAVAWGLAVSISVWGVVTLRLARRPAQHVPDSPETGAMLVEPSEL